MNVLDASLFIFEWFQSNDSFSMEADFIKIKKISDEPEKDRASFLCALESLEKYEIVQSCKVKWGSMKEEQKYWVLVKPLASQSQNVELDSVLAGVIAETINAFSNKIERSDIYCDPMNITASNIRDLAFMATLIPDNYDEENESENEKK